VGIEDGKFYLKIGRFFSSAKLVEFFNEKKPHLQQ